MVKGKGEIALVKEVNPENCVFISGFFSKYCSTIALCLLVAATSQQDWGPDAILPAWLLLVLSLVGIEQIIEEASARGFLL